MISYQQKARSVLAVALPALPRLWKERQKPLFTGELAAHEHFRNSGAEVSRNILPGGEVADGVICAERQIPKFSPARLLVEMGDNDIGDGQNGERADLSQQIGDIVRPVENEVELGRTTLLEPAREFLD